MIIGPVGWNRPARQCLEQLRHDLGQHSGKNLAECGIG
jgi:hypothetical protein